MDAECGGFDKVWEWLIEVLRVPEDSDLANSSGLSGKGLLRYEDEGEGTSSHAPSRVRPDGRGWLA